MIAWFLGQLWARGLTIQASLIGFHACLPIDYHLQVFKRDFTKSVSNCSYGEVMDYVILIERGNCWCTYISRSWIAHCSIEFLVVLHVSQWNVGHCLNDKCFLLMHICFQKMNITLLFWISCCIACESMKRWTFFKWQMLLTLGRWGMISLNG